MGALSKYYVTDKAVTDTCTAASASGGTIIWVRQDIQQEWSLSGQTYNIAQIMYFLRKGYSHASPHIKCIRLGSMRSSPPI